MGLMRRGLIFFGEAVLLSFVIIAMATLYALWYIAKNPVDLTFIKSQLVANTQSYIPNYTLDFEKASLRWNSTERHVQVRIKDLTLAHQSDQTIIEPFIINQLDFTLSVGALLKGELRPETIHLSMESFSLVRKQSGALLADLGFGNQEKLLNIPIAQIDAESLTNSGYQSVQKSIEALFSRSPLWKVARRIEVEVAHFDFEDSITGNAFSLNQSFMVYKLGAGRGPKRYFSLESQEIRAKSSIIKQPIKLNHLSMKLAFLHNDNFRVELSAFDQKSIPFSFILNSVDGQDLNLDIAFKNFKPKTLWDYSENFEELKGIDLPLSGKASFVLNNFFMPLESSFEFDISQGEIRHASYYPWPLNFSSGTAKGRYDFKQKLLAIEQANARFMQSDAFGFVDVAGAITVLFMPDGMEVKTQLDIPASDAKTFLLLWPNCQKPNDCLRGWFIDHKYQGLLSNLSLRQHVFYSKNVKEPQSVYAREFFLNFDNSQVQPFATLPLVRNARGSITIKNKKTFITLEPGTLSAGQAFTASEITITQKAHRNYDIHLQGGFSGSLKRMLSTLAKGEIGLGFLKDYPLENIRANAQHEGNLAFQMDRGQIKGKPRYQFKGSLKNVYWENFYKESLLRNGEFTYTLNENGIHLGGRTELGDTAFRAEIERNFNNNTSEKRQKIRITSFFQTEAAQYYFPWLANYIPSGTIGLSLVYDDDWQKQGQMSASLDVGNAKVVLPFFNLNKEIGQKGNITILATVKNGRPYAIEAFEFTSYGPYDLSEPQFLARGTGLFKASGNDWQQLNFEKLDFRQSSLRNLTIDNEPQALIITLQEGQFDATELINSAYRPSQFSVQNTNGKDADGKHVIFNVNKLNRILLPDGKTITDVVFTGQREGNLWNQFSLNARMGVSSTPIDTRAKDININFSPTAQGLYQLEIQSDDAGAFLHTVGFFDHLEGGQFSAKLVTAKPFLKAGLEGNIQITNFHLNNQPALSTLLNLASFSGIADVLSGQGLWIDKMLARIRFDRGLVDIMTSQMAGPSLAIRGLGQIDFDAEQISIAGSLTPFNFVSRTLNGIPVISEITTGRKGEGLLAADFTISGPFSDPLLQVNPLSVLTPGIFREMFNELTGNISPFEKQ